MEPPPLRHPRIRSFSRYAVPVSTCLSPLSSTAVLVPVVSWSPVPSVPMFVWSYVYICLRPRMLTCCLSLRMRARGPPARSWSCAAARASLEGNGRTRSLFSSPLILASAAVHPPRLLTRYHTVTILMTPPFLPTAHQTPVLVALRFVPSVSSSPLLSAPSFSCLVPTLSIRRAPTLDRPALPYV